MRHLNIIFFFNVLFFLRLAQGTLVRSRLAIEFSRGFRADKLQISYLDALQHILRNGTGRLLGHSFLNAERDDYAGLVAPVPETFYGTLTLMPPRLVKLKFKASQTTRVSSDGDIHGYRSAPSKAFGHPTPTIALFTSLYLWQSLAIIGFIFAIGLISSFQGILKAIECIGKTWYDLSTDIDACVIFATELALIASWRLLCFIDISMGSLTMHLSKLWSDLSFIMSSLSDQVRIRQWQERHIESIRRKNITTSPAKPCRPYGKYSRTPLFEPQVHETLKYSFLPEEPNKLRHMYNPLHFNQVKRVGVGAFGSVYQIENRITGRMMAMKTLVRENNTDEEFNLEIRALARLQDGIWYTKLSSTFKDVKNFYLLMPLYHRGDLYSYVMSCGGCLHRTLAKFYLAELLLAIQGIHKAGIIHRDLKPENILFGEDGHLVVADFGVAHVFDIEDDSDEFREEEFPLWAEMKRLDGDEFPLLTLSVDNPHGVSGLAGTAFYSAPEVKLSQRYSYGVDYYSMAILYHEMVTGFIPYHIEDPKPGACEPELILDLGRKDAHFQPISMMDSIFLKKVDIAGALMYRHSYNDTLQMLDKDPYARPSVKQMKEDLVFATIDWEKMAKHQVPIPPSQAMRKRVPISHSIERCLTQVGQESVGIELLYRY